MVQRVIQKGESRLADGLSHSQIGDVAYRYDDPGDSVSRISVPDAVDDRVSPRTAERPNVGLEGKARLPIGLYRGGLENPQLFGSEGARKRPDEPGLAARLEESDGRRICVDDARRGTGLIDLDRNVDKQERKGRSLEESAVTLAFFSRVFSSRRETLGKSVVMLRRCRHIPLQC